MNTQRNNHSVVLVYPGQRETAGYSYQDDFPVGLLYIAKALQEIEISVSIHDARKTELDKIDLDSVLLVGFTVLTGDMIAVALKSAQRIRNERPDIPIVFGGIHPSTMPEQTAEHPLVDIVVVGEGERTTQDLAQCLAVNGDISEVKGIVFQNSDGEIVKTGSREYIDLDTLDYKLPYELLDYDPAKMRLIPVHTSRGCPWRCSFCYNVAVHNRSYRVKSPDRVLEEIEYVVKRFNVHHIDFTMEDEFFINKKRVRKILEGIVERKLNIRWEAFIRFDTLSRLDDDFMELMVKSGITELSFGAESGSQRILDDIVLKDVKVEQIIEGIERLKRFKIGHLVSFICGFPTETESDLKKTFKLIERLSKNNPYFYNQCIYLFCPIPGTSLFDTIQTKYGWRPYESLEEWGDFEIPLRDSSIMTWLTPEYAKMCESLSEWSSYRPYQFVHKEFLDTLRPVQRQFGKFVGVIQRARMKKMYFENLIEFRVYGFLFGVNSIYESSPSLYWRIRGLVKRTLLRLTPSLVAKIST